MSEDAPWLDDPIADNSGGTAVATAAAPMPWESDPIVTPSQTATAEPASQAAAPADDSQPWLNDPIASAPPAAPAPVAQPAQVEPSVQDVMRANDAAAKAQGVDPFALNQQRSAEMDVANRPDNAFTSFEQSYPVRLATGAYQGVKESVVGGIATGLAQINPTFQEAAEHVYNEGRSRQAVDSYLNAGSTLKNAIQSGVDILAQAVPAASLGLPGMAAYFGGTTAAKTLTEAEQRGVDTTSAYQQAATHGTIDAAWTMIGGKFLGSALGKLAGAEGQGLISKLAGKLTEKLPLPQWTKAVGNAAAGASGQVAQGIGMGASHYLGGVATGEHEFNRDNFFASMESTILPSLVAGLGGEAIHSLPEAIPNLRKFIGQIADTFEQRAKELPEAVKQAANEPEQHPEQSAEADAFRWAYAEADAVKAVKGIQKSGDPAKDGFAVGRAISDVAKKHGVDIQELHDRVIAPAGAEITPPPESTASAPQQSADSASPSAEPSAALNEPDLTDVQVPDWLPENDVTRRLNGELEASHQKESGVEQPPNASFETANTPDDLEREAVAAEQASAVETTPPTERPKPNEKERTGLRREINQIRRREILPQSTLDELQVLDHHDQRDIIDSAKQLAAVHNEYSASLRQQFMDVYGSGKARGAASARAAKDAARGGDETSIKRYDQIAEALRQPEYAELAAETDKAGGILATEAGGAKQFADIPHDEYIGDILRRHQDAEERASREGRSAGENLGAPQERPVDAGSGGESGLARPEEVPPQQAAEQVAPFSLSREASPDTAPIVEPYAPPSRLPEAASAERQPNLEGMPTDMEQGTLAGQQGLFDQPGSVGAATPGEIEGKTGTSLKNAVADWERKTHGLDEATPTERRAMDEAWDKAKADSAADPQAGERLAQALIANPERGMTDEESALLLKHKVDLLNAKNSAAKRTHTETTPQGKADAEIAFAKYTDDLSHLLDAIKARGSQWGREGRWRQALAFDDYSLETMQSDARAKKGRELTPKEHEEVKAAYDRIAELEEQLVDAEKKSKAKRKAADAAESTKRSKVKHNQLEKEAKADQAAGKANLTPQEIIDGLDESSDPAEISNAAKELFKHFLRAGLTDRDAITSNVNAVLRTVLPDFTPIETVNAITDYGKFRPLNKDPIETKFREQRAELLQIRKLAAMDEAEPLLATGQERQSPTDEHRRLTKFVNELKKKYGIKTGDPETQLKSALDAMKTRRRNRIADLKQEIASRRKTLRDKFATPEDTESLALQKELDALNAEHKAIFGNPKMSDAQRLKAAETAAAREAAEYTRRVDERDFSDKAKQPELDSPNLFATKLLRDAARDQYNALKAVDPASMASAKAIATKRLQASLSDRIVKLQDRRADGDFAPRARATSDILDPETNRLRVKLEAEKIKFDEARNRDMLARRTPTQKIEDAAVKWSRVSKLLSWRVYPKLLEAALARVIAEPISRVAGSPLQLIAPDVYRKARLESGGSVRSAAESLSAGFTSWGKAWQKLRTGKTDIDVIRGRRNRDPEMFNFVGNSHGMMKEPIRQAAFARGKELLIEQAIHEGLDVHDPVVQASIISRAAEHADRNIFMRPNEFTKYLIKVPIGALRRSDVLGARELAATMEFLMPIANVPSNIAVHTLRLNPAIGLGEAFTRLAVAAKRGELANKAAGLSHAEAETISRAFKLGMLGTIMAAYAWTHAHNFGGVWEEGTKKKDELKHGEVSIMGVTVPAWMNHAPEINWLNTVASARRVYDRYLGKHADEPASAAGEAFWFSALAPVKNFPFIDTYVRMFSQTESFGRTAGAMARDAAIPSAVTSTLNARDEEKKKPTNFIQEIEMGIPGLRGNVPAAQPAKPEKPQKPAKLKTFRRPKAKS